MIFKAVVIAKFTAMAEHIFVEKKINWICSFISANRTSEYNTINKKISYFSWPLKSITGHCNFYLKMQRIQQTGTKYRSDYFLYFGNANSGRNRQGMENPQFFLKQLSKSNQLFPVHLTTSMINLFTKFHGN